MGKNILIVYTNYSTFVAKDFEFLSQHFEVDKYQFKSSKNIFLLTISFLKQFIFLLFNLFKYESIFIWFSDYHSSLPVFFSRTFNKKSFLVIGGYDATGLEEISYGIFYSNFIRKAFNKYSIKNAHYLFPVDKSLVSSNNFYASKTEELLPMGIKHIVKNPKGEIVVLPTGYDINFWKKDKSITREESVVCIAGIKNKNTWILKGGDLLLEIAKITPNVNFYFYGIDDNFKTELLKEQIPHNFNILGYIKNENLPQIYSKHKVYAQFSLSEGLPNVLCEAMLCECIPVGSNVNGIPNAINNPRFILKVKDILKAKEIILEAINIDEPLGEISRNSIITNFNEKKRQTILLQYLN